MRISDWSSDVCSSDLLGIEPGRRHQLPADRFTPATARRDRPPAGGDRGGRRQRAEAKGFWTAGLEPGPPGVRPLAGDRRGARDRKSGVEGKRVSVGVYMGGRVISKKKKKKDTK